NRRNGSTTKVLKGQDGAFPVTVPRDRDSSFEPELIKKGQTRIDGIDDRIIGLYAAGLTVRDIQTHLLDLYGLKVSPDLISRVTDAVLDEVREWQGRALDRMYPIVIFDALRVKIRDADSRTVKNKAVYVALGVTREGVREVLGLWIAENEGAKFWLSVMNELKNRGIQDILIAVVDGLKGFPEAITAAFPEAMVQTCIVHLVRHSLNFCSWKDRKAVAADLRRIYGAATADMAAAELDAFE
ncbi:IS256 family transposase, partial [Novacetimonas pomaceti]